MSRWLEFSQQVRIGDSAASFDSLTDALFGWEVHRRAGLQVNDCAAVALGATANLLWRLGPIRVSAPVEVVAVLDSASGRGFTYRALPGHPEEGEESFRVVRRPDGHWFQILARSRPATWWARAAGPVTLWAQRRVTAAYLRAAKQLAAEAKSVS